MKAAFDPPHTRTGHWPDDLLSFANADDPAAMAEHLSGTVMIYRVLPEKTWGLAFPTQWPAESVLADHAALCELLEALVGRGTNSEVRAKIFRAIRRGPTFADLPDVRGMLVPEDASKLVKLVAYIAPREITQWYGLALQELLAQKFRFGRCPLESCRDYFVAKASRGQPRLYCFDPADHAAQDRMAASRAKKTAKQWRRRK